MVVFDVSFQLSFLATFALIFVTPVTSSYYANIFIYLPAHFKIRETIISTLVIEIMLLPILLYTAGSISFVTVFSNLLILPTLPFVMGIGFVAIVISFVSSIIAWPIIAIAHVALLYIIKIAEFFSALPFVTLNMQLPLWGMYSMYAVITLWFLYIKKHRV
jgi:competence protein ComEC